MFNAISDNTVRVRFCIFLAVLETFVHLVTNFTKECMLGCSYSHALGWQFEIGDT
jgi:hypothetical protein